VPGNGGCTCPTITLTPLTLPDATTNQPYNQMIDANGGTPPYTFTVTSGSLPSGITLSTSGLLSGTPDTAGNNSFTVTATDSNLCSGSFAYSLNVVDPPPCLFCDNFEDGVLASDWTYFKQTWSETGGNLIGTPTKKKVTAIATPVFAGCVNCTIKAKMMSSGAIGNRISLLVWYLDKKNYVELMMREDKNRWILKQRSSGTVVAKQNFTQTIDPNVSYDVEVNYDGTDIEVLIDGTSIITMIPGAAVPNGTVGFQSRNATGTFEEINVN
jgi:hypothetical protein